ncbi:hypothetical protein [Paeniglutamicibacter terrestris]|uniref:Uncharacterized protein n=1 Tax=Paeniglutamicibacter terrestris TaxID=2723403 RepID=A0ABX1G8M8_9MICC|nr:hypothetical protein [Paeniglutamicibacter terrestris]NKG22066.1 hypothetical protein [Paeniglutamicibacter terrestris]
MSTLGAWNTKMRRRNRWVQQMNSRFDQLQVIATEVKEGNPADITVPGQQVAFSGLDKGIEKHLVKGRALSGDRRWLPGAAGNIAAGPALERMHAIEDLLLRRGNDAYMIGHLPTIHASARAHLAANDPLRIRLEKILQDRSVITQAGNLAAAAAALPDLVPVPVPVPALDDETRSNLVSVSEAAHRAYQVEYAKLRNFVRIIWTSIGILVMLTVALGFVGSQFHTVLSPCFVDTEPTKVICLSLETTVVLPADNPEATAAEKVDSEKQNAAVMTEAKNSSTSNHDIFLIEFIGLVAAAISGASSLRRVSGSSTPYNPAIALAFIKLPIGALTAVLGLMLLSGGIIPGLTALDTSGQILAWAIIFGASQQLFMGLVDQKAKTVLDNVGSNEATDSVRPATA